MESLFYDFFDLCRIDTSFFSDSSHCWPLNSVISTVPTVPGSIQCMATPFPSGLERGV